jgi:hypothetical protein
VAISAEVVNAWKDQSDAFVVVRVEEPGRGSKRYRASTPLHLPNGTPKTALQVKNDLIDALRAERDSQLAGVPMPIDLGATLTLGA